MGELLAISGEWVRHLTGLSGRQLQHWEEKGVYAPEFATTDQQPVDRVYSFADVVALRALAQARAGLSLQQLRTLGIWLQEHRRRPWSHLRFSVGAGQVFVSNPETGELAIPTGHAPARIFEMEEFARDTRGQIEQLRTRNGEHVGRIARRRNVMSNAPVIAGTRIPTTTIWDFHEAGYDAEAILREYPQLTLADVQAAISYELRRRKRAG